MLSLEMLDVAIGVVFLYLLLSLVCTAINEFLESFLKLRAVDLEQGIRELLDLSSNTTPIENQDATGQNSGLAAVSISKQVYDHPLIASLFRGRYNPNDIRKPAKSTANSKLIRYSRGSDLPSYIPARNFALALMDVVKTLGKVTRDTSPVDGQATMASLTQFRAAVERISNDNIKKALLTIIDSAGDDLEKVRAGIEAWYNSAMDRVSGWYKRRVQQIVFILGFIFAIALNADTFAVYTNLANDRPLRTAIVAQAETLKPLETDTLPPAARIKGNVNALLSMGLPIGWNWKNELESAWNPDSKLVSNYAAIPPKDALLAWLFKVLGWLVTGLAISLGAPFWFDVLNKIMVIRSTVKPREKSQDEGSEDRKSTK